MTTVDDIMAGFVKLAKKLANHIENKQAEADEHREAAILAQARHADANEEKQKAERILLKVKELYEG